MKCEDIQVALGAEPTAMSPELEAHLRDCPACVQYRREMLRLDDQIRRALMIDVDVLQPDAASGVMPEAAEGARSASATVAPLSQQRSSQAGAAARTSERSSFSRGRHWALAASVLLAVTVVLVMWGALPRHSLAADVVSHVVSETLDEPPAGPVDEGAVAAVMARSGIHLDPINPSIVFVRTCFLRGRLVPHFIVRTEHGDATVLILPDEHVKKPERFDGSGYKGLIVPDTANGSIVLLSRADVDMERYAGEIRRAVHMLPPRRED